MQYTINELKREIFKDVYDVYEIFQNFFDEEHTDLQGIPEDTNVVDDVYACTDIGNIEPDASLEISDAEVARIRTRNRDSKFSIIVWWPRVTITNEHNKSINIQDLFAKVVIDINGKIPYEFWGFELTRSTYDSVQFRSGYVHSHVPGFSSSQYHPSWYSPCLGTGPIRNTIVELKNNNTEATWMLFCQELSMYVTVESLTGGPYRKLEEVGVSRPLYNYREFSSKTSLSYYNEGDFYDRLKQFILYYLEHGHLTFVYQNGMFKQGFSYFDYMIDISNSFIEWFNQNGNAERLAKLYRKKELIKAYAADGKFYECTSVSEFDSSQVEGTTVLRFKNQDIGLRILQVRQSQMEETTLLCQDIAMYILQNILKIINYRYRNEYNNRQGAENSAPTYQTVYYL